MSVVSNLVTNTKSFYTNNKATIYIATGVVSGVAAIGAAIIATPKAMNLIQKRESELKRQLEPLKNYKDTIEVIKTVWKTYIPTAFLTLSSGILLVSGNYVHLQNLSSVTAAYKMTEKAYYAQKKGMIESLSEKQLEKVTDKMAENAFKEKEETQNGVLIAETESGKILCMDNITEKEFYSTVREIRDAISRLNFEMTNNMDGCISLQDFYDEVGADGGTLAQKVGWNVSDGLLDINVVSKINPKNDRIYIYLIFDRIPKSDYQRY